MSDMPKFEVGDVCELTSGGPPMTVTFVNCDEAVCAWFDNDDQEHRSNFPFACLDLLIPDCDCGECDCTDPLGFAG